MGFALHFVNALLFHFGHTRNIVDGGEDVVGDVDAVVYLCPCAVFGVIVGVGLVLPHALLPSEVTKGIGTVVS